MSLDLKFQITNRTPGYVIKTPFGDKEMPEQIQTTETTVTLSDEELSKLKAALGGGMGGKLKLVMEPDV